MTSFREPDNKSIQELEDQTIKFWNENSVFQKSVDSRNSDNLYVFFDGPPFVSGLPHFGHLLGSIAKDLVPRYWTMKGKKVERVWGWDAHGITVENKVQKKLGIKDRKEILEYGLKDFIKECYVYTSEISSEWKWYIEKIGRWADMDNAYRTTDMNYMESVMWVFKSLCEKGVIYQGIRTSLYCPTCGTPVSNFEIAMDNSYKDFEDPAVTVKFVLKDSEFGNCSVLGWTTTPWTLPSNRALVVDEKETYVLVEGADGRYIVAKKRFDSVFDPKKSSVKIIQEFFGSKLVGLAYEPLYAFFGYTDKEFKIYSYDGMVHMEEGTGIVHSAPGFGEIDTRMGEHFGLTVMMTIDEEGKFLPGDCGENPFSGMYFAKANRFIEEDLQNRGLMFKNDKIIHRIPYHDRCDTNIIQRAQQSWFVDVQGLKSRLLELNKEINWVPSHLKDGRFAQNIESAPDWSISRSRFWATPMPVWQAEDGDRIVVGSIKELEELSGQRVVDLHRPFIDEIVIEKEGKTYTRIPDVLDSWFEAGSMPYGQIHYPFENQQKFESNFPGDYIIEYIAQVRAWFYVMHVLSTALFDRSSFKNVISTGVMAGSDGRKMSKTYGNYTDPKEILEQIGGDSLRLFLMGSPLMVGENANFDDDELKTKLRNVVNPLWNSTKFFLIYAKQHRWSPENVVKSDSELDKWIVGRLHQTIRVISQNIENYTIPPSVKALEEFVDDLSRWYVRRSRDRISSGDNQALSTLYTVLLTFSKAAAPIIPFITEQMYQYLKEGSPDNLPLSVHLCDYPNYDEDLIDSCAKLFPSMLATREIVSLALSLRVKSDIKVRQPLQTIIVKTLQKDADLGFFEELVADEVNVKDVKLISDKGSEDLSTMAVSSGDGFEVYLDTNVTEELAFEGNAREIIRSLQALRKQNNLNVNEKVEAFYEENDLNNSTVQKYAQEILKKVNAVTIAPSPSYDIKKIKS